MRSIFVFLFISSVCCAFAQDSLNTNTDSASKKSFLDKINFFNDLEFFQMVNESKSKCEQVTFDVSSIQHFSNRKIRNIEIEVLNPLGHVDTSKLKRTKMFNVANKLHRTTPKHIVEDHLLIKTGAPLNVNDIVASQQLLFENPMFRDAKIIVIPVEDDEEAVDILVMVQDLWSWSFSGEATDRYVGGGLVFNKFAGLPHQFSARLRFNFDRDNIVTPTLTYRYRNIKGKFVDAGGSATHDKREYKYAVDFKRNFFSAAPQWAAGFNMSWNKEYHRDFADETFFNNQDAWLAKSFAFNHPKLNNYNIILGGRFARTKYTYAPDRDVYEIENIPSNELDDFADINSYLISIGIANRNFVSAANLFDFFPYRNLQTGFNAHLVGGIIDESNLTRRGYLGGTFNHAVMKRSGYFHNEISAGTYFNDGLEQITVYLKNNYFTNRFPMRKWGLRQYVYSTLGVGFVRPDGERLSLNNSNIKGLRKFEEGNSFYSLSLETEIQSPINFMGFQARFFLFADIGTQGNQSDTPFSGAQFYHAYGFGARFNHWNLGIDFLELAFVYYPNISGLANNHIGFVPDFGNRKAIEPNNLYDQYTISTVD